MQPTAARSRGVGQPVVVESLINLLLSRVAASTADRTADRRRSPSRPRLVGRQQCFIDGGQPAQSCHRPEVGPRLDEARLGDTEREGGALALTLERLPRGVRVVAPAAVSALVFGWRIADHDVAK